MYDKNGKYNITTELYISDMRLIMTKGHQIL